MTVDTFQVRRRGVADGTFVVIAYERDYSDGKNVLRNIIYEDEQPRFGTIDRGRWIAQGIANVLDRHVFLYSENRTGSSCGPVFPVDGGPYEYPDLEPVPIFRCDYAGYIENMQKEGRWQGDRNHPKYPWKGGSDVLS